MFKLVVLFSVVAMAAAKPSVLATVPLGYSGYSAVVPGSSSLSEYSTSVVHGAPALYSSSLYSPALYSAGVVSPWALSQAPHSPAVVLDAVRGVPLDTPEVVAARAAHYTAKALAPHHLRKRSLSYVQPTVVSYSSPVVSAYSAPLEYGYHTPLVASPLGYSTFYPRALSVHPY